MKNPIIFMMIIVLLFSCNTEVEDLTFDEEQLLKIAYSDTVIWDDDFYLDNGPRSVYYINTVCTTPLEQNVGRLPWRDLAANTYSEAKNLVDSTRAIGGDSLFIYTNEIETEKYYDYYVRDDYAYRVHKMSYFEPLIDRLNITSDTMGIYHGLMTENNVIELSEYLFYRNRVRDNGIPSGYGKILSSEIESFSDYYLCMIVSMLTVGGDWGITDQIHVHKNEIKIIKNTRYVLFNREQTHQISGAQN
ncbi:MAG: hypothetical protein J7L40_00735 [Candidatus Marinimicrobia bacterium]|nr:hypothetical protein [Candidatus Neomarinimicrobiota bacterium]